VWWSCGALRFCQALDRCVQLGLLCGLILYCGLECGGLILQGLQWVHLDLDGIQAAQDGIERGFDGVGGTGAVL
jgi:hypothetical protein